ncbi:MAG: metallophosphoesterase [Deltaproteobacteria bacterium]|nr:metallophosphoesterase [Deltaproteobacteria bacterium]
MPSFALAVLTHGAMDRLYEDVLAFEAALGVRFEWVLHAGDFGIWPDPHRIDKATRKHDGAGDFPAWFAERRTAPRKTLFIKGNHEDFVWLDMQHVLPGLFYLRNGRTMDLGEGRDVVRVGGVGGCYGPSDFDRQSKHLQGYAKRHFTRDEIETLSKSAGVDILLVHDAPAGVRFERHRRGLGWMSEAAGLDQLVAAVRPRVCFFGHHHTWVDSEVAGVRCIGLNKVRMRARWNNHSRWATKPIDSDRRSRQRQQNRLDVRLCFYEVSGFLLRAISARSVERARTVPGAAIAASS